MIQENETLSVRVDMTYVGGRLNFQLFADKEIKPTLSVGHINSNA